MNLKTIILSFLMVNSIILFSQEKQKSYLIGGSIGFSQTNSTFDNPTGNDSKAKTTSIYLSPTLGYYITNNIALGLEFTYSNSKRDYDNSYTKYSNNQSLLAAPFIRCYITQNIFGLGQVYYGKTRSEAKYTIFDPMLGEENLTIKSDLRTLGFGLGIGYSIGIAENIYLEPMLKYNYFKYTGDGNTSKDKGLLFNLGFTINISK